MSFEESSPERHPLLMILCKSLNHLRIPLSLLHSCEAKHLRTFRYTPITILTLWILNTLFLVCLKSESNLRILGALWWLMSDSTRAEVQDTSQETSSELSCSSESRCNGSLPRTALEFIVLGGEATDSWLQLGFPWLVFFRVIGSSNEHFQVLFVINWGVSPYFGSDRGIHAFVLRISLLGLDGV